MLEFISEIKAQYPLTAEGEDLLSKVISKFHLEYKVDAYYDHLIRDVVGVVLQRKGDSAKAYLEHTNFYALYRLLEWSLKLNLNPDSGELSVYYDFDRCRIVPHLTFDGYVKIDNFLGLRDDVSFTEGPKKVQAIDYQVLTFDPKSGKEYLETRTLNREVCEYIDCHYKRRDFTGAFTARVYFDEFSGRSEMWGQKPNYVLRQKAYSSALRQVYGLNSASADDLLALKEQILGIKTNEHAANSQALEVKEKPNLTPAKATVSLEQAKESQVKPIIKDRVVDLAYENPALKIKEEILASCAQYKEDDDDFELITFKEVPCDAEDEEFELSFQEPSNLVEVCNNLDGTCEICADNEQCQPYLNLAQELGATINYNTQERKQIEKSSSLHGKTFSQIESMIGSSTSYSEVKELRAQVALLLVSLSKSQRERLDIQALVRMEYLTRMANKKPNVNLTNTISC